MQLESSIHLEVQKVWGLENVSNMLKQLRLDRRPNFYPVYKCCISLKPLAIYTRLLIIDIPDISQSKEVNEGYKIIAIIISY